MHLLIATAGVLPPEPVADFAEVLVGRDGRVTVMNVTQTPHEFLKQLAADEWRPFDASPDSREPETLSAAERYVEERGSKMAAPVVAALQARNIEPRTLFVEADEVAEGIIGTAEALEADVIVLGTTQRLFDESAWTSISMKVASASKAPVLLIPQPDRQTRGTGRAGSAGRPLIERT
ncbi:MAG: universal stress protein [bacterium]|nr:universal stress protein [bacterium]MDE0289996.1 universal stress protein [bacterium]MDE0437215.1 universal stress protein [bacterium]